MNEEGGKVVIRVIQPVSHSRMCKIRKFSQFSTFPCSFALIFPQNFLIFSLTLVYWVGSSEGLATPLVVIVLILLLWVSDVIMRCAKMVFEGSSSRNKPQELYNSAF